MFARQNPGKRRVRFPDEVVFEDEIKEQDGMAVMDMLRRASIDIDINRINSAGESMRSTAGMPVHSTGNFICWRTWVGLTLIWDVPPSC